MAREIQIPKKTGAQKAGEFLVILIVVAFVCWVIERFFTFLISPFVTRYDYESMRRKVEDDFCKRIDRRNERLESFEGDETDPMHQFQERFLKNPEDYKGDPDNEVYYAWYKEWKSGGVIDTDLRWAPDVYDDEGVIMANFLDYLELQVNLHEKVGFLRKLKFLFVIRNYYPEFTPSFEGIRDDIEAYRAELDYVSIKDLAYELGLSDEFTGYCLGEMEIDELKKNFGFFKKCVEFDYCPEASVLLFRYGIEPGTVSAYAINGIITKMRLTKSVSEAFIKGEISDDDVNNIYERVKEEREIYGSDFLDREDEFIEDLLVKVKAKNRAKKVA